MVDAGQSRRWRAPQHNPFSTGAVRPGAIAYRFSSDCSPRSLVQDLRRFEWRGQIVGPHGTGKSTLLHSLHSEIRSAGRQIRQVTVRGGQRALPLSRRETGTWCSQTQVIVDGYEQLSWLSREFVRFVCRRRQAGLLVTAHADVGLPDLFRTEVTPETARALVARLLAQSPVAISTDEVDEALSRCDGNFRETLFCLYDLHETRRRTAS